MMCPGLQEVLYAYILLNLGEKMTLKQHRSSAEQVYKGIFFISSHKSTLYSHQLCSISDAREAGERKPQDTLC